MQQRFDAFIDRFMGHVPPPAPPKLSPSFFTMLTSSVIDTVTEYSGWLLFLFLSAIILGATRKYINHRQRSKTKTNKETNKETKNVKMPCAPTQQIAKRAQGIGRSLKANRRDPSDVIWSKFREAVVDLFMVFESPGWLGSSTGLYKGTAWFCSSDGYLVTAGHNTILNPKEGMGKDGRLIRASQIIATVTNLNGETDQNRALVCRIVNVCGRADVAVLHIKEVTNQKYIRWGNSLETRIGSRCNVIGDPLGQDTQSVASGLVRNNMYFEPSGQQIPESILTTALAFQGNSGSPMLNAKGESIGVYTFGDPTSPGFGGGITQRIAQPIVEEMIAYDRSVLAERSGQTNLFQRPLVRHPKGVFPHIDPHTGDYEAGYTGLVFNGYTSLERYALGNLGTVIGGAVVVDKVDSKLFRDVQVGDIITAIDGISIGTLPGQTAPSTGTLLKVPGDSVQLTIYRGKPNTVWTSMQLTQTVGQCPPQYDYPLSFVAKIPVHSTQHQLLQKSRDVKSRPFLIGPHAIRDSCDKDSKKNSNS